MFENRETINHGGHRVVQSLSSLICNSVKFADPAEASISNENSLMSLIFGNRKESINYSVVASLKHMTLAFLNECAQYYNKLTLFAQFLLFGNRKEKNR